MAFVIKFVKGVRNHWKKSTFAVLAVAYGVNYTKDYFETQELMRVYCQKALKYGLEPLAANETPRNVTVILNPNANRRKATKLFENYCAPILNLGGLCVDVVQTQSEGHARTLLEELDKETDAIVIAGGDGTVSDVVTGLMRRNDTKYRFSSIGILPLGRTNTVANVLFPVGENLEAITRLAEASLAVVEEKTKKIDVMKIEVKSDKPEEQTNKPVYAVGTLEWGAYRDAHAKLDKYWYFGSLRKYVTYIFNGYKNSLNWTCAADVIYSPPCDGCRNCYISQTPPVVEKAARWWSSFAAATPVKAATEPDYAQIVNENCVNTRNKELSTADVLLTTALLEHSDSSYLTLNLGPPETSYLDFVNQGWQSEQGKPRIVAEKIQLRQIEIVPKTLDDKELWFSIDHEDYEVKPIKITLLPKILNVYCKKEKSNINY